jgi:hypothetical protein
MTLAMCLTMSGRGDMIVRRSDGEGRTLPLLHRGSSKVTMPQPDVRSHQSCLFNVTEVFLKNSASRLLAIVQDIHSLHRQAFIMLPPIHIKSGRDPSGGGYIEGISRRHFSKRVLSRRAFCSNCVYLCIVIWAMRSIYLVEDGDCSKQ